MIPTTQLASVYAKIASLTVADSFRMDFKRNGGVESKIYFHTAGKKGDFPMPMILHVHYDSVKNDFTVKLDSARGNMAKAQKFKTPQEAIKKIAGFVKDIKPTPIKHHDYICKQLNVLLTLCAKFKKVGFEVKLNIIGEWNVVIVRDKYAQHENVFKYARDKQDPFPLYWESSKTGLVKFISQEQLVAVLAEE